MRVVFGIVRNLAISGLLWTPYIDRFVKSLFTFERSIVPYNTDPVLILVFNDMQEALKDEKKDKAPDVFVVKEDTHVWCAWWGRPRFRQDKKRLF